MTKVRLIKLNHVIMIIKVLRINKQLGVYNREKSTFVIN